MERILFFAKTLEEIANIEKQNSQLVQTIYEPGT